MMTKRQRVEAVIRGNRPDRVPVGFWHHFPASQITGQASVDAHLAHLTKYDLDFLKVMNDHRFPRGGVELVRSDADLERIEPLPGDTGGFADQLDVLRTIRSRVGEDVLVTTTIFNPWAELRRRVAPPTDEHGPPKMHGADSRDNAITQLLQKNRPAVKAAVEAMGQTIAGFARLCIEAGADGIFLSVRDDWVDRPANGVGTYDDLVRPVDRKILDAAAHGTFNVLHVCGRPLDFDAFARYPVHVINWADREAGPSIAEARDRVESAIAGGVNNLGALVHGTPEQCAEEVRDALQQANDRPMIVAPGCTYDPNQVPTANLQAVVTAARAHRY